MVDVPKREKGGKNQPATHPEPTKTCESKSLQQENDTPRGISLTGRGACHANLTEQTYEFRPRPHESEYC